VQSFPHPLLPSSSAQRNRPQVPGRLRDDGRASARHHPRAGCRALAHMRWRALPQEAGARAIDEWCKRRQRRPLRGRSSLLYFGFMYERMCCEPGSSQVSPQPHERWQMIPQDERACIGRCFRWHWGTMIETLTSSGLQLNLLRLHDDFILTLVP
jgi:hypothetical protein